MNLVLRKEKIWGGGDENQNFDIMWPFHLAL
jgi:hypothetical protein